MKLHRLSNRRRSTNLCVLGRVFAILALSVSTLGAGLASGSAVGATTSVKHATGVLSHIELTSTTLVSGATERGTLVIDNNTGKAIRWDCPYLEVQLTNAHFPLEIHPTPCPQPAKTLHVGTTRLPFSLRAGQTVCEGSCKLFPPGVYHTQVFAAPNVANPPAITVHVVAKPKQVKIRITTGEPTVSVKLRVGQTLQVTVDPAQLDWVADTNLTPALTANNPCDTTCNTPGRTFTAMAPGHATIQTVQHCGETGSRSRTTTCALGPAIEVTVTAD